MKKNVCIIPAPQSIHEKNGLLITGKDFNLICSKEFSLYAKFLAGQVSSCNVKCEVNGKNDAACKINVSYSESITNEEAYTLDIDDRQVNICARDKSGALFAIQSLKQLIISNDGFLPCVEISDYPDFKWRGFMLDTCRAFFSVEFIKKLLDAASFHKLNRFHWHLTDDQGWRFNVPQFPLLTKVGANRDAHTMPLMQDGHNDYRKKREYFYTDEMIKDVVAYAAERNITIVPEVELPGHVSALLASYPEYGCTGGPYKVENRWGIFKDVLCLGNEKILDIYTAAFKTLVRLFPGKWIHIGGDECLTTRWKKCPKCQALKTRLGLDNEKQLQSWVTKTMSDVVLSLGKIPIGWDEVLDHTEKNPLAKDVIVQSWRKKESGYKTVQLKHYGIMSPVNKCYLNFKNYNSYEEPGRLSYTTVKKAYSFSPVGENFTEQQKSFVLGGECNMWTENIFSSRFVEYMMFPRFCALSECMWLSPEKKDFKKFKQSLAVHKERLRFMNLLFYDGALE